MPSDSNGVFSLPNGYQAVTGETIQASQHNPPLEDLASAMTQRLMRSGAAPMTGPLKIVDGSVGSPAVQFANASSTGIYKTANGIGVSVNGNKVAEFGAGGIASGAFQVGDLIPWTRLSVRPLCVFPYGQNLNRADYPDLWAVAQVEIAAGNTFYNNGNGTTTFGIGDVRGRVIAGKDDMGGSAVSRLTSSYFGTSAAVLGAASGAESNTLSIAQMPIHGHTPTVNDPTHAHLFAAVQQIVSVGFAGGSHAFVGTELRSTSAASTGISVSIANNGGGQAHANVQPTMICNYVLFAGGLTHG